MYYGKIKTENLFDDLKGGNMIAYIKGILEMKYTGYIVIDVGGIGYKIYMSESAIERLGNIGEPVKVHTHHHVREDNISLYGFNTSEELNMFELLLGVSGVGAKSALVILSNISPSSFALAVATNDTSRLTKIPGIGAKSAARIVLELKDKLKSQEVLDKEIKETNNEVVDNNIEEAVEALQVLGYNRKEIKECLSKMDCISLATEDIIKKGLAMLSR